jgi:hypothetical protein
MPLLRQGVDAHYYSLGKLQKKLQRIGKIIVKLLLD